MKHAHENTEPEESNADNYDSDTALEFKLKKNFGLVLSKRPVRGRIINDEDIMNLKIALGTAKTIDDFCENGVKMNDIESAREFISQWDGKKGESWSECNDSLAEALVEYADRKLAENVVKCEICETNPADSHYCTECIESLGQKVEGNE